ncbi:unnamed protein product, partial [Medioppia subpectinata]
ALQYLPNNTDAVKVYPYFSVIHDMDLSQSISKNQDRKIAALRDAAHSELLVTKPRPLLTTQPVPNESFIIEQGSQGPSSQAPGPDNNRPGYYYWESTKVGSGLSKRTAKTLANKMAQKATKKAAKKAAKMLNNPIIRPLPDSRVGAGNSCSQSVCTNSDNNSASVPTPEPQSPTHPSPPKVPQKIHLNLIKESAAKCCLKVVADRDDSALSRAQTSSIGVIGDRERLNTESGTTIADTPCPTTTVISAETSGHTRPKSTQHNVQQIGATKKSKNPELLLLYHICYQITDIDVRTFTQLCRCVRETAQTLGPYVDNSGRFWSHVNRLMSKSGYPRKAVYNIMFTEHVCSYYKIALKYLPNYTAAVKVYPYFSVIHDMDLSQSLSHKAYDKIQALRDAMDTEFGPKPAPLFMESVGNEAINIAPGTSNEGQPPGNNMAYNNHGENILGTFRASKQITKWINTVTEREAKKAVKKAAKNVAKIEATNADTSQPLAPGTHRLAPINYLGVELNPTGFATTASSPHLSYSTKTASVRRVWVTVMLVPVADYWAIVRLIKILKANAGAIGAEVVDKLMAKSGFDGWHYDKCLNYFHNAIDLYKKTLANCPNRETAATVYPLFNTMHSFVPSVLLNAKELVKLNELKRLFAEKCGDRLNTTNTTTTGADNHCPTNSTAPDIIGIVARTSGQTNVNNTQHSVQPIAANKELVNWELHSLRKKCAQITEISLRTFTQLCRCVGETATTLGPFVENSAQFWPHVIQLVAQSGYPGSKKVKYRQMFTDHVCCVYAIALKLLVDLNGCENYSIRIDRTDSAVVLPFNQVYNEIRKQIKHNITSNTHVFEIFDTDFNVYCVIPSDEYLIEDLSRLRVRPKTVNNESIGLGINRDSNVGHKYSHKIQYERKELKLSENNINKSEDREDSTAGDSSAQSVCTTSDSNRDSLPAPEPQSLTPPSPPKLPQKMSENVIKEFNAENGIKVVTEDNIASQSIASVVISSHSIAQDSHKSRFSFTNIVTNAGHYVKQTLGLSTRTGTGVSDGVANEGLKCSVKQSLSQSNHPIPILLPVSTPIPSPLAPGSHPSAPINYLNIELNPYDFATTSSSPHMAYITYTACVGTVWLTGMSFLLADNRAVIRLMHILKSSTGQNDADIWVNQMSRNGFNDWNYTKCLNYFYNALKLYKKTLANCPNRETASTVYPLFRTMHSFVPYFLMTAKDLSKLNELKRLFDNKCEKYLTKTDPIVSATPVAGNGIDSWSARNQQSVIYSTCECVDSITDNEYREGSTAGDNTSQSVCTNSESNSDLLPAPESQLLTLPSAPKLSQKVIQNLVKKFYADNEIKVTDIKTNTGRCVKQTAQVLTAGTADGVTNELQNAVSNKLTHPKLFALYQVCAGITDADVTTFTQLCRCVGETVDTLGSFVDNRKQFWPHVNRLMVECGYPLPKLNTYRKIFTAHVCTHYKIALQYLPNNTEAVKVCPYFSVIHDMDLSQSISKRQYGKITALRDAVDRELLATKPVPNESIIIEQGAQVPSYQAPGPDNNRPGYYYWESTKVTSGVSKRTAKTSANKMARKSAKKATKKAAKNAAKLLNNPILRPPPDSRVGTKGAICDDSCSQSVGTFGESNFDLMPPPEPQSPTRSSPPNLPQKISQNIVKEVTAECYINSEDRDDSVISCAQTSTIDLIGNKERLNTPCSTTTANSAEISGQIRPNSTQHTIQPMSATKEFTDPELQSLYHMSGQITELGLRTFTQLCQSVRETVNTLGPYIDNCDQFWPHVNRSMTESGYLTDGPSGITWRLMFIDHVCCYYGIIRRFRGRANEPGRSSTTDQISDRCEQTLVTSHADARAASNTKIVTKKVTKKRAKKLNVPVLNELTPSDQTGVETGPDIYRWEGPADCDQSVAKSNENYVMNWHRPEVNKMRELRERELPALYRVSANITQRDLRVFTQLCRAITATITTLGLDANNDCEHFWSGVSRLMDEFGYPMPDGHRCRTNFTEHVCNYYILIFDIDFNEYCIISSDNHVIENLSRLRVRPKTVNNESIGLGINRDSNVGHKYSHKLQYEKNELNLSENNINKCEDSINDYEDREETEGSTAGDNTSQSVCTNSESNSDSLPAPEPQSPTPPLPPKLPQKMPENIIKEFNAENDIKVADRDDSALPSPQTPAIDLTAHTV